MSWTPHLLIDIGTLIIQNKTSAHLIKIHFISWNISTLVMCSLMNFFKILFLISLTEDFFIPIQGTSFKCTV